MKIRYSFPLILIVAFVLLLLVSMPKQSSGQSVSPDATPTMTPTSTPTVTPTPLPTRSVQINVLYDDNGDGYGDRGVGAGVLVDGKKVGGPYLEFKNTNELSAVYYDMELGDYNMTAYPTGTVINSWRCKKFIRVIAGDTTLQIELACQWQWGLYMPLILQ